MLGYQELIHKEKVHIDCEKGAQISISPTRFQHNDNDPILSLRSPNKLALHLFVFSLFSHYVTDLIKTLEMRLMVVSVFLKIKFRHAQISLPKIGIPMSKSACINPRLLYPKQKQNLSPK